MIRTFRQIAGATALLLAQIGFAPAADIKVFSTIGVQSALEELAPQFEKATGHKLNFTWATAAILVKRVQAGESADLMVLTKQSLEALIKDNKASAGPDATLASSGIAVVAKKGAPKPDISTPEAFKQALLNAKTIAYSDPAAGGTSGVYFAKLLERMGIAEQMKTKTRHPPPSGNAALLVVNGEAELAIQQEPELISVAGVDLVGPLPAELNNITMYSAGVGAGSQQAEAANALIRFLRSPEAQAVFKAKGLKPADAPKGT
jgi:molybdate transport system substrate-binding protein